MVDKSLSPAIVHARHVLTYLVCCTAWHAGQSRVRGQVFLTICGFMHENTHCAQLCIVQPLLMNYARIYPGVVLQTAHEPRACVVRRRDVGADAVRTGFWSRLFAQSPCKMRVLPCVHEVCCPHDNCFVQVLQVITVARPGTQHSTLSCHGAAAAS